MRKILLICGLNLLVLFGFAVLLLFTPLGGLVVNNGKFLIENYVTYEQFEGTPAGKSRFTSLVIRSETVDIVIEQADLDWNPLRLFKKSLQIGDVALKGVTVTFKTIEKEPDDKDSTNTMVLPEIVSPFSMIIGNLIVDDIVFADSFEQLWQIRRIELACQSDGQEYIIQKFVFDSQELDLDLKGTVLTERDWPVDISGQWQCAFEGYNRMAGSLHIAGRVENLDVELSATRPVTLQVSGGIMDVLNEMGWQGVIVDGKGSLHQINETWPNISIQDLSAKLQGDLESYKGTVSGNVSYMDVQNLKLDIELDGDLEGIVFPRIHGAYKDGRAEVQGVIGWEDFFFWRGKGDLFDIVLDSYSNYLLGRLNGQVLSQGRIGYGDNDVLHCFVDVPDFSGTLNGYSVSGKGRIAFDDEKIGVEKFSLYSGDSTIEVDGTFNDELDFSFYIDSPDLSHFIDGCRGQLLASATVKGSSERPFISYEVTGSDLEYDQQSVKTIHGAGQLNLAPDGQLQTNIEASELISGDFVVSDAEFSSRGTTEKHQLSLRFNSNILAGDIRAEGRFSGNQWIAGTESMLLNLFQYGEWESLGQTVLTVDSDGNVEVKKAGLQNAYGAISGAFSRNHTGNWTASLQSKDFNLDYIRDIVPIEYKYQGTANLDAVASGNTRGLQVFDGNLALHGVQVRFVLEEGGEEHTVIWEENTVTASLNQQQLDVAFYSSFNNGSFLKGTLVDENFSIQESTFDGGISGKIDVEIEDLASLSWLTYSQVQPSGALQGEFTLGGTLFQPEVNGKLDFEQSRFFIPAAGITLEENDIQLAFNSDILDYSFTSHSGGGSITGEGVVHYGLFTDVHGTVVVKGSDFEIVNLPDYEVVISPDMQLVFNRKTGKLTGKVVVENTVISPEEFNGAISESNDVVYVDSIEEGKKKYWPLMTDLDIVMGENVRVDSFGLKSYLDGQLKIKGDPGEQLAAFGELWLRDGTFSIYARTLDIKRGQAFFTGGPIENPILDVRAQKSIDQQQAGSQGSWTVGVDVSGAIDDLHYELFSTPALEEADILAYMIVGHSASDSDTSEEGLLKTAADAFGLGSTADFMQKIGAILPVDEMHMEGGSSSEDASIVIGKRLTDDIFLGYDYNFFKSSSEFIFRYDLGRGFYLESRSSAEANSGDLFYTFEK